MLTILFNLIMEYNWQYLILVPAQHWHWGPSTMPRPAHGTKDIGQSSLWTGQHTIGQLWEEKSPGTLLLQPQEGHC